MSIHTRLYDDPVDARRALDRLYAAGIDDEAIGWVSAHDEDTDDKGGVSAAATGSGIGALLGGGAGALAGVGLIAIPGLGPVVAAGWLASTLTGALAGAVAGGVTGGIADGLATVSGVEAVEADVYAEGVRRGGVFLTVRVPNEFDARVTRVFDEIPTPSLAERRERYRKEGWTGTDPATRLADEAERQRSA